MVKEGMKKKSRFPWLLFLILLAAGAALVAAPATLFAWRGPSLASKVSSLLYPENEPGALSQQFVAAAAVAVSTATPTALVIAEPTAEAQQVEELAEVGSESTSVAPAEAVAAESSEEEVNLDWPQTAQEFLEWVTEDQPPLSTGWLPLEVGEIHRPVGEPNAWAVGREKNMSGNIVSFYAWNQSPCMQDGWMSMAHDRANLGRKQPVTALGSGIPADWKGPVQGLTFRPCTP